jgi:hypothetical protein
MSGRWITVRCWRCAGHGIYASGDGSPEECEVCWGSGQVWLSSRDRYARWPGGPLCGSDPGAYTRAVSFDHQRIARMAIGDLS